MQGGVVVQTGTPDEILNNPANDYVRTFFRGVDISHVFSAKDIAKRRPETLLHVAPGFGPRSALKVLEDEDRNFGYLIERGRKFVGIVSVTSLEEALKNKQPIESAILSEPCAINGDTPLNELISTVAQSPCAIPVIDEKNRYIGLISKGMLLQALDKRRQMSNTTDKDVALDTNIQETTTNKTAPETTNNVNDDPWATTDTTTTESDPE